MKVKSLPKPSAREVHIWKTEANEDLFLYQSNLHLLNDEEKDKAGRFKFTKDRVNFETGKIMLRILIGAYLGIEPKEVNFSHGLYGKPFLKNDHELKFNLSHAGNVLISGFSIGHDIGVDVEYNKMNIELAEIASHFFSKKEYDLLMQLPQGKRLSAFYSCWTRKESFIKAKGSGLSIPLSKFDVSLSTGDKAAITHIDKSLNDNLSNWDMKAFMYGDDYTCAALVNCPRADFQFFDWQQYFCRFESHKNTSSSDNDLVIT